MAGEINSLAPVTATPGASLPAMADGEIVKLLQSIDGLLQAGQTAKAEVLALKQTPQDFEMLLKLTLPGGRETNVQVSSSQPLLQGTTLVVTQPTPSNLAITVQQARSANVAALTEIDTRQMPPGTLLQGKVLTCQVLPQGPGLPLIYRSLVSLLNTAQAGATLSLDSPRPLTPGSLLSAQVQDAQALNFVPLSGRLDQLALTQQLTTQQARQASLQGLLSALQTLANSEELPAEARNSAEKLLAGLPDIRQLSDAKGVAQALNDSGVFLESRLLGGQTQLLAPDLKAQLFRLVAQLLPAGAPPFDPATVSTSLAQVLPGFVRSALGALGQVSAKAPPGNFPLPSRLLQAQEDEGNLEHLLKLAAGAVSRLQSHQLASLAQTGSTPEGSLQTTWQLEIPLRTSNEFMPLQVKLQREEPPQQQSESTAEKRDAKELLWQVELAFDMYPLGPLQVQAQLVRGSLSSQLWAEDPATARLVDSQLGVLRERLIASGLSVAELNCHHGTPPQGARTHLEQRWVDENA
ncbi:flagellar hook-length control protein FliK [Pseudomonas akapageensis]|uniref:flagellar hook-length control protein FliK n=1 Tax=Pseudomonas akapageensis TaxID=2609961 RepID=UPI001408A311|nr:flagellar hook-length control protein FliK [Pseudomonas akapageensis]